MNLKELIDELGIIPCNKEELKELEILEKTEKTEEEHFYGKQQSK